LGKELLDRVEIGRVFGQEDQPGTGAAQSMTHGFGLMRAEIVHDHEVAPGQGRDEHLFDVDEKAFAVDRPVEQPRCLDPVTAQRGEEGHRIPMAERCDARQAGAAWRPAPQRRHVRLGPGFVDEDQPGGIDARPELQPLRAAARDIGPGALAGNQRLFLYVSAAAWTNSQTER